MPATLTKPKPKASQPEFWQQYSARHEFPFSITASVLIHVLVLLIILRVILPFMASSDDEKPCLMDVVEIEGGGGGRGGSEIGPGILNTGNAGRKEGAPLPKNDANLNPPAVIPDFKFDNLPNDKIIIPPSDVLDPLDAGKDPFAAFDNLPPPPQNPLPGSGDPKAKAGGTDKAGLGGGKGGPEGSGVGKGKGPGQGDGQKGGVLTDQRRRELRWRILASNDGDVHLKKLQALKCTLVVPLRGKPGEQLYALKYDFSKPSMLPDTVKAVDDYGKVRWKNSDVHEMQGLAKALGLKEVPIFTVIYLPSDLERNMAERELAYQGRKEHEIQMTVWDVRERDGGFDNEPYIVQQFLRPGIK